MRTVVIVLVLAASMAAIGLAQSSQPAAEPLPPQIARLRNEIRGLRPIRVRKLIKSRFGEPTRDLGSGIWIPQWDIAGGKLTFHPLRGPTFTTRSGAVHWLLKTKNPARQTIRCQYEMATRPDPANHGTRFWIGDVYVDKDLNYRFVDGRSNLRERGDQSRNFLMQNPTGRVEVEWAKGINDDTPLESAGDGVIAHLVFHAAKDRASFRCRLTSSAAERSLDLAPEQADQSYQFDGGWKVFWPTPPANDAETGKLLSTPP
jgi:hypothetical protein